MPTYKYPNDGKLHTRYSELVRATPQQVDKLVQERFNLVGRFENKHMEFGTIRHKSFERESKRTGFLPVVFKEALGRNLKVTAAEYYFETEITIDYDGSELPVVIHSTVDAYLKGDHVTDFKVTTQDIDAWGSKQQLVFYAYLLGLHGIPIKRTIFLLEKWNEEKTALVGYTKSEKKLPAWKIKMIKDWIDERVFTLKMATDLFIANNPEVVNGYEQENSGDSGDDYQGDPD